MMSTPTTHAITMGTVMSVDSAGASKDSVLSVTLSPREVVSVDDWSLED